MFSGIVQSVGVVEGFVRTADGGRLRVASDLLAGLARGESVCVSGACLTVTTDVTGAASFDLGPETLQRTTLGKLTASSKVNLELPLRPSDRIGGHFVQGHVDCAARVVSRSRGSDFVEMRFSAPREQLRYVVEKGYVAVDGVSLTAVSVDSESLSVALIPTTRRDTTLGELGPGDYVNLEVDILSKYVERFVGPRAEGGLTIEKLAEAGFLSR